MWSEEFGVEMEVFDNLMTPAERKIFLDYAGVKGDKVKAADEFIQKNFTEKLSKEDVTNFSKEEKLRLEKFLDRIYEYIQNLIKKITGTGSKITKADIIDAIKASAMRLRENAAKAKAEAEGKAKSGKGLLDKQGNPIDVNGKLVLEKVSSIKDITDADFTNASRNVQLPDIPKVVSDAIGANGKPIVIKKNIFEKNLKSHKDLTPEQSREILDSALYRPDLYGQNQPKTRAYNWILIHNGEKHSAVIIEIANNKDNIEVVNWHYLDNATLEQKKRQAEREGGLILTLASASGNNSSNLSSAGKGNNNLPTDQTKGGKKVKGEKVSFNVDMGDVDDVSFSVIGEKGASALDKAEEANTRSDNLSIAREMESKLAPDWKAKADENARKIKMATGWERGADGKWRYEISDIKIKEDFINSKSKLNYTELEQEPTYLLSEVLEGENLQNLFDAYPKLKNTKLILTTDKLTNRDRFFTGGYYDSNSNELFLNFASIYKLQDGYDFNSIIVHEIQHIIQDVEGFANGGEPRLFEKHQDVIKIYNRLDELNDKIKKLQIEDVNKSNESIIKEISDSELRIKEIDNILNDKSKTEQGVKNKDFEKQLQYIEDLEKELSDLRSSFESRRNNREKIKDLVKRIEEEEERLDSIPQYVKNTNSISIEEIEKLGQEKKQLGNKINNRKEYLEKLYKTAPKSPELEKELKNTKSEIENLKQELYNKLAGEVESRNVQARMDMTPEQRKSTLLSETEDVAREDQIFLENGGISDMGSRVNKRMNKIAEHFKGSKLNDVEQSVIDVYSGIKNNVPLNISRADGDIRVIMRQGVEDKAGTKHSLLRHYDTGVGVISSDDLILIPKVLTEVTRNRVDVKGRSGYEYKLNVGDIKYTIYTEGIEGREEFCDFYSNKKGDNVSSSNTQLSARARSITTEMIGKDINNFEKFDAAEIEKDLFNQSYDIALDSQQTTTLNSKQTIEVIEKNRAEDFDVEDDVLFKVSKNNRKTIEGWLDKREDLTLEDRNSVLDYLDNIEAEGVNLSTLQLALVDGLPKELDNGITIYDVDSTQESRENMRKIINTHFGKDASPWCLLQGDGNGNLTKDSKNYWRKYSAYRKQVAFVNGKLTAFSANDSSKKVWWDRQDRPNNGILFTEKLKDDVLGRKATYEFNLDINEKELRDYHKGNKQNGHYQEWNKDGILISDFNYKNGKQLGENKSYYDNGVLREENVISSDGYSTISKEKLYYPNGQIRIERTMEDGNRLIGEYKLWYDDGQLCSIITFDKDGKQVGEKLVYYNNGQLEMKEIRDEDGKYNGVQTYYYDNGQVQIRKTYLHGVMNGSYEEFTEDGFRYIYEEYKNNKLHGINEEYNWSKKRLIYRKTYADGVLNGLSTHYDIDGNKTISLYKDGKRNGYHAIYDKNDILNLYEHYKDGELHGESIRYYPGSENVWTVSNYKDYNTPAI